MIHDETHQPQRAKLSTVISAPFRSKLESDGLQVDPNCKFSERIFSTLAIFKATYPSFWAHRATLMAKTGLTYPAFADLAAQFCTRSL